MDIHEYEPLWGHWSVGELIGQGSYGRVYHCTRTEFSDTFESAVKIISIPGSDEDISNARAEGMDDDSIRHYYKAVVEDLLREIILMDRLKGLTNVVSIEDHLLQQHEDGFGWDILIRMAYLTPLSSHMTQHKMTVKDTVRLGMDISRAIDQCRQAQIIHRDIKPDNIFLSDRGDFKLGDFGIARQLDRTQASMSQKGTIAYMAPEVYKGERYDMRADIYSLGLVMYRILNRGRLPFLPDHPQPVSHRQHESAVASRMGGQAVPPPVTGGKELTGIVLKACAFDPGRRYGTPGEMLSALEGYDEKARHAKASRTEKGERTVGAAALPAVGKPVQDAASAPRFAGDGVVPENQQPPAKPDHPAQPPEQPVHRAARAAGHPPDRVQKDKGTEASGSRHASPSRRRWLIGAGAACLAVTLLCVFLFVPGLRPGARVELPDFTGRHFETVLGNSDYAFEFEVVEGYESGFELGTIYDQFPSAYIPVKPTSKVTLYVHLVQKDLTLPDVTGMKSAEAASKLAELDVMVEKEYMTDPDFAFDTVIFSSPQAGSTVKTGSIVTLYVSDFVGAGSGRIIVPDLGGMTYRQAQEALGRNTLKEGEVSWEASTKPKDTVLGQGVPAGTEVDAGTEIDLVLSAGDSKVTVPNLVGLMYDKAKAELKKNNLKEGAISWESSTKPKNTVLGQSVAAGSSVAWGSAINLVLSAGEATVSVPYLIGLPLDKAVSDLESSGLKVGSKTPETSTMPKNTVISQSISSGTSVAPGTTVNLTYSNGEGKVTMPDLINKSYEEAKTLLSNNGLLLGSVYTLDWGSVTWQSFPVGTPLSAGTVVSLGLGHTYMLDVVGKDMQDAMIKLNEIYLDVIMEPNLSSEPYGTIIWQYPGEGTQLTIWSQVRLSFSSSHTHSRSTGSALPHCQIDTTTDLRAKPISVPGNGEPARLVSTPAHPCHPQRMQRRTRGNLPTSRLPF